MRLFLFTCAVLSLAVSTLLAQPRAGKSPGANFSPIATLAVLGAEQAYARSLAREILLIDIRHPDEWAETGIATTAVPITMHQDISVFLRKIREAQSGHPATGLALICAQGSRSRYMQRFLYRVGFRSVMDVSEGMIGGPAGKGWIASKLPVRKWIPNSKR